VKSGGLSPARFQTALRPRSYSLMENVVAFCYALALPHEAENP
jgi:hypothetical protein